MTSFSHVVPPEWDRRTVKEFARRYLGLSARVLTRLKQGGGLLRNHIPCRTVDVLFAGDVLELCFPEESQEYQPVEGPLSILWEDENYLVLDKPPAMPVHPSPGHDRDSLLNRVAFYYQQTGQTPAFRPLYRLDRDTSGIVVVGKHRAAVSSAQVEKAYFAVVEGELTGSGKVDVPIGLEPGSKIRRQCRQDGQPAVTHWESLAWKEGHSLLRFRLETGRTHQIRVHMAYINHPLAGDDLYGGSREWISRQALHCRAVSLACVPLHADFTWNSPFPEDLLRAFPWVTTYSPANQTQRR
ncbi:MAG: RluA family pseudouridine synthase [Acutalibacter sp.]|jgi:23S rRNA pseudouridine1911/1915/1917 synthase